MLPGRGADFRRLRAVAKRLRFGQALEPLQRQGLDLANALASDAEGAADLFQGARALAIQAIAKLDYVALALGQGVEHRRDVLAPEREGGVVVG